MRPPWWFWTVYVLGLLAMFVLGAMIAVLCGGNPYIGGTITAGVTVLKVTYEAARGRLYMKWWEH